jgi:hypothetical protein
MPRSVKIADSRTAAEPGPPAPNTADATPHTGPKPLESGHNLEPPRKPADCGVDGRVMEL